jgi:hypothetical protein
MLGNVHIRTFDRHLLTRRCVRCGYDGANVNRSHTGRCPRCGCDLTKRRPRSYAEMEGLLGSPTLIHGTAEEREVAAPPRSVRTQRLVHRWVAFAFIAMLVTLAIVYLGAAIAAI